MSTGEDWLHMAKRRELEAPPDISHQATIAAALIAIAEELHELNDSRQWRVVRQVEAHVEVPDELAATLRQIRSAALDIAKSGS